MPEESKLEQEPQSPVIAPEPPSDGSPPEPTEPVTELPGAGTEEPTEDTDPLQWTKQFDEAFGSTHHQKYADDGAFLDGINNALHLASKRDEDASLAKDLRKQIGNEALQALAATGTLSKKSESEPVDDPGPSYPSDAELEVAFARAKADDATDEDKKQYTQLSDRYSKAVYGMLERLAEQEKKTLNLETQLAASESKTAETQQQQEANTWFEQNKHQLHPEGDPAKGLTPLGKRASDIYEADSSLKGLPPLQRYQLAMKLAVAEQPKVQPIRKPGSRAKRQAGVATPAPQEIDQVKGFIDGKLTLSGELERLETK